MKSGLVVGVAVAAMVAVATPASAAQAPVIVHFDLAKGQQPENIALEPDGSADLTFTVAGQVARVRPNGHTEILATFPTGTRVSGIVHAPNGTLYVNAAGGGGAAVWRIRPGRAPERVVTLPPNGFPNGLALDGNDLYLTDSAAGTILKVTHGKAVEWLRAPVLAPTTPGGFGVNGIKVHQNAVWVSVSDKGLVLRIPIKRDGTAGTIETKAIGLPGIDDFTFSGRGNEILAAINSASEVTAIQPNGSHKTILTSQNGLSNPTSVAVRGNKIYIPSAAYATRKDPNLLITKR